MSNSIIVEADDDSYQRESGIATGTISPGDLIEGQGFDTAGGSSETQVARNTSDGAVAVPRIALEMAKTGKTVDDDYASDDYIEWKEVETGDVVQVRLFDGSNAAAAGTDTSDNANITPFDYLVPYGGAGTNGSFRKYDSADGDSEGQKMFQAVESADNSSGTSTALVTAVKV